MKITPIPHTDLFELVEPISVVIDGKRHVIPSGYRANGASIPKFLIPLSTTPYHPTVTRAYFFHDWFYDTHEVKRRVADKIFYEILLEDGTDEQVALNMYNSVKDFGRRAWKRAGKEYKRKLEEVEKNETRIQND